MISYFQQTLNLHRTFILLGSRKVVLTGMFCLISIMISAYKRDYSIRAVKLKKNTTVYVTACVHVCVQEGVGDPSSGDSGTLLRHAVCSITWCFVSHRICQKRSHLVLLRSVLLQIIGQIKSNQIKHKHFFFKDGS